MTDELSEACAGAADCKMTCTDHEPPAYFEDIKRCATADDHAAHTCLKGLELITIDTV